MPNAKQFPPVLVNTGQVVHAVYRESQIPDYQGNPLIEALPPVLTEEQAMVRLEHCPKYDETQRHAPDHIRYHLIQNGMKFFAPLDIHVDLERRFSCLLRVGYTSRNPLSKGFWNELDSKLASLDQYWDQYKLEQSQSPSTAPGFNIIGISGIGKSQSVLRVLSLYPQVINHSRYRNRNFTHSQITWLKLDCPFDGSIKGLCISFFQAIDDILRTNYRIDYSSRRMSIDELLTNMAVVAANHLLGVLVIDELQRLSLAKGGGAEKMLNFFVQLVNTIGVPVVLVGNYKALPILSGDFSQMRRGTGQGDLIWDRMAQDEQWQLFVESLWRFQYTKKKCTLDQNQSLSSVLYEETQGITDFAVKVYMFAQERAIDSKKENITASIIRSASKDYLRIPRTVLVALKNGDKRVLEQYEDLYHQALHTYVQQHSEHLSVKGKLASSLEITPRQKCVSQSNTEEHDRPTPLKIKEDTIKGTMPNSTKPETHEVAIPTKANPVATKGELPQIIVSIKTTDSQLAYEALRAAGHIRHSNEYLNDEELTCENIS
ncbi:MAG TPA: ATP-binding protein [Pyrinomonadaceae bacterium]|nr:ATP-binding protein [Pyrinomonadaceae bacterium]